MASQAKGKKKTKGKTFNLNTFLGEDQDAPSGYAVVNTRRDWADMMENEDLDDKYTLDLKKDEKVVLPTAPKAARGPDVDLTKVPTRPPYTAYLGNLPYDVSEDDITHFFRQLEVTNVRLPRDNGEKGRIKGFGYAEFYDRQGLIQALALNNESLKNRAIKVCLAGEHEGDRDRDRRGGDGGPDRTLGDWRSGSSARDDYQRNDGFQSNRGFSDRDRGRSSNDKDYGFQRDRMDRNERNGDRFERNNDYNFGRDQDRRSNDRGYGFSSSDRGMGQRPMGGGRMERRDGGRDFGGSGGGRDYGSSNYGRREDTGRDSRYSRDASDRDPPYSSRDSYDRKPDRPAYDQDGPKERRKLQLAPRTKPIEPTPPPSDAATASSIFGGAKPVDTAARERVIEERLARERDTTPTVRETKESSSIADDSIKETDDVRTRRFSTGSGVSNRSRRSSDSGPPGSLRDEEECVPPYKPPLSRPLDHDKEQFNTLPRTRQRCSSNSSTGSDSRDNQSNSKANLPPSSRKENYNANCYPRTDNSDDAVNQSNSADSSYKEAGYRSVRNNHSHRDISNERISRGPTHEEPKPPVYTSANKFSHLMADGDDLDRGSGSE